jgi:hypothetical protein
MLPPIVERRVEYAESVAHNLRAQASELRPDQTALRLRFLQAAQAIDELVALVRAATITAKFNHDTIVSIAQAYRETVP